MCNTLVVIHDIRGDPRRFFPLCVVKMFEVFLFLFLDFFFLILFLFYIYLYWFNFILYFWYNLSTTSVVQWISNGVCTPGSIPGKSEVFSFLCQPLLQFSFLRNPLFFLCALICFLHVLLFGANLSIILSPVRIYLGTIPNYFLNPLPHIFQK